MARAARGLTGAFERKLWISLLIAGLKLMAVVVALMLLVWLQADAKSRALQRPRWLSGGFTLATALQRAATKPKEMQRSIARQ